MSRALLAVATVMCCAFPLAREANAFSEAIDESDRVIEKEPEYRSTPKYSLLVLGDDDVKVWMVEDDRRLFVDKNANGDLTDDGPPIKPSKVRNLDADRRDFEYSLDAITPIGGGRHTDFVLRRWNYGEEKDSYGLSLSVDGRTPMYAGWFGSFWSTKREQAPAIHFGGPFTPKLLRKKQVALGGGRQRISVCLINPGSGEGAASRLSIEALPPSVVPELTIEWPTAAGGPPLRTSHPLTQRCCYWEFYTRDFAVPEGVVEGKAKAFLGFPPDAMPVELTTAEIEVPVVAPRGFGISGLMDAITDFGD